MCVVIMSAACVYSGHDLGCPIFGCVDRHQLPSCSLHLPVALDSVLALVLLAVSVYSETLAGYVASVCTGVSRVAVVLCFVCWLVMLRVL